MLHDMDDVPVSVNPTSSRFIDQLRMFMRTRHMAWATEKTYVLWVRRYIRFHKKRHPVEMGAVEIEEYLNHLALVGGVAPGTQAIALNALVFLYKRVLDLPLDGAIDAIRAERRVTVPVVLTREEVSKVISLMEGVPQLVVKMLYGSGLRVLEGVRLRVKDLDFQMKQVTVRAGKGDKDRLTTLSAGLVPLLENQLKKSFLRQCTEVNRELWLVLSLFVVAALCNFLVANRGILLSFYTFPTLFSAYFYGRRHATLTALASVLLVVLMTFLNPHLFEHGGQALKRK